MKPTGSSFQMSYRYKIKYSAKNQKIRWLWWNFGELLLRSYAICIQNFISVLLYNGIWTETTAVPCTSLPVLAFNIYTPSPYTLNFFLVRKNWRCLLGMSLSMLKNKTKKLTYPRPGSSILARRLFLPLPFIKPSFLKLCKYSNFSVRAFEVFFFLLHLFVSELDSWMIKCLKFIATVLCIMTFEN